MPLQVYGLAKCSTCQKALAWLDEHGIAYSFTDYAQKPPSQRQAEGWVTALGGWEKLINRSGYTWRGLPAGKTQNLDAAGAVALVMAQPSLIRRPLIEHGKTVTVGFSEKVRAGLKP